MRRWAPAGAWAALLLVSGVVPGVPAPALPGLDKVAHAGGYAVFGLLFQRAAGCPTLRRAVLAAAAAGLLWGGVHEGLQHFVAGRSADVLDLLANVAGAAAGGGLGFRTFSRAESLDGLSPREPSP